MAPLFSWDESKAAGNFQKHGVSFEEGSSVFYDPFSKLLDDSEHSVGEERFLLVGLSIPENRLLVVAHVERGDNEIRLISARLATRRQRKRYEEE